MSGKVFVNRTHFPHRSPDFGMTPISHDTDFARHQQKCTPPDSAKHYPALPCRCQSCCGHGHSSITVIRTYLIIDRTMRYVQNTKAARREVQSIPAVLTSRTTQRRRVLGVTQRDGGCDSVREAPVREQTHKPRRKAVFAACAPLPAPLFESPSPGRYFRLRRCCSLLVWAGQTALLAPSRKRKSLPSHARAIMR